MYLRTVGDRHISGGDCYAIPAIGAFVGEVCKVNNLNRARELF